MQLHHPCTKIFIHLSNFVILLPIFFAALGIKPKNVSRMLPWVIEVKTEEEIEKMRAAGRVAREVLDLAGRMVCAGVTTDEIDNVVHEETLKVRKCSTYFVS